MLEALLVLHEAPRGFVGASLIFKTMQAVFLYIDVVKGTLHSLFIALNNVIRLILLDNGK